MHMCSSLCSRGSAILETPEFASHPGFQSDQRSPENRSPDHRIVVAGVLPTLLGGRENRRGQQEGQFRKLVLAERLYILTLLRW
jgi:hypothetical protein